MPKSKGKRRVLTNYQAQRLNALGLSYEVLCDLRSSYKDGMEFSEVLFSEEQGCTRKTSKACQAMKLFIKNGRGSSIPFSKAHNIEKLSLG